MCAPGAWTARAAVRASRAEVLVAAASAQAAAVTRAEKARGMAVWHSQRRMLAAAFRRWYVRRRWMPHWTPRVRRQRHLRGAAMVRAEERVHALSLRLKLHAREEFIGWREAAQAAAKAAKRAARTLVWRTGRVKLKLKFLRWRSAGKASSVPPPLDGNLAGAGCRCVTKTDCAGASHDCATRIPTSAPPSGQSARAGRRERVDRDDAAGAAEAAPARASARPIPRALEVKEKAPLMSEPERHRAEAAALATKLACQRAAAEKLASTLRWANLARRRAEAAGRKAAEAAARRSAEAAAHELASKLAPQCAEAAAQQSAEAAALEAELARRRAAEEENEAAQAAARKHKSDKKKAAAKAAAAVDGAATAAAPTKKRKVPAGVAGDPGPQELRAAADGSSTLAGDDPIAAARLKEKKEAQAVTKQLKKELSERHRITTKQLQLENMGWKAGMGTPAAGTLMALLPGHAASAHAAKKPDHTVLLRQVLTHLDATEVEAAGAAQAEPAAVAAAAAAIYEGAGGEGGEEVGVRGSSQR